MATRDQIITYIYDLKDKVTGKLRAIVGASKAAGDQADRTAEQTQRSNDKIGKSYDGVGASLGKLRGILAAVGVAFSFSAIKDGIVNLLSAGDAAERVKIQLSQLYGSQEAGSKAFDDLRALAKELGTSFDATRDAALKLKAVGLEPLDGTLKSLINQNALLGGSQETLTGITLALGQAWAKQKLQTEEILQLVERGVPAFDLLAKVTGKQGVELQKLIQSGNLGRETIRALIEEIGRSSEGAAAKSINTLGSLITQLKDQFTAFLERIANSGAADFFKEKLKGLRDEIELMVNDGRLQKFAEDTSNNITKIGEAVSAVASKWRILSGASDAAAGAVQTSFAATVKLLAAGSASVTGFFANLTGKGKETADTFDRLNTVAGDRLSASLKKTADGAQAVGEGFGLANRQGSNLGGTFANVKAGADSTASAFRNVESGVSSTAKSVKELGDEAAAQKAKVDALADAFKTLNVKSQADLQAAAAKAEAALNTIVESYKAGGSATAATTADVANAFEQYAAAQRATVANAKEFEKAGVEGALNIKAALLGLSDTPPPTLKPPDVKPYVDAMSSVNQGNAEAADSLAQVGDQAGETSGDVGNAAQAIQNIYSGFAGELGKTSQAAIEQFTTLTRQIFELSAGIADFSGLARFGKAAQDAYDIINERIARQKEGVAGMAAQYADLGDSAVANLVRIQGGTENAAESLELMAAEARNGRSEFDLLGAQDLSALASALDSAAAKTRQIADEARAAKEQLRGIADSLQDELDRAAGRNADIENRRYQQQLDDIKRLAEASGNLNSAEYNDAISRAKQLHDLNLRNIAEEKKAREAAKKSTDSNDSGSSGGGSSGSGGSAPSPSPTPQPKPGSQSSRTGSGNSYSLTFNITGNSSDVAREVKKQLDEIARRSR